MISGHTTTQHVMRQPGEAADDPTSAALSDRPIRVLHIIPRLGPGGAERVLFTLMGELGELGVDSTLCVLGTENAFPDRLRELREPIFLGYSNSYRDIRGFRRCVGDLRDLIRDLELSLVHSHLWPAARLASVALRKTAVPHLVHIHDTRPWLAESGLRNRSIRLLTRLAFRRSRCAYVAVSDACRRYTQQYLPWVCGEIPVVHNGFDADAFAAAAGQARRNDTHSDTGELVVGSAGRLSPEKGQEHLIQAAALLQERAVPIRLRIAGEGSLRRRCEQLTDSLGLADSVELTGKVHDMSDFYRSLNVFALPSVAAEGLPMVILEAMAMGLPTVATNVAGTPEVVRDGTDGLLVPPADPAALADAIQRLAQDPPLRQRLGQSARQRVRQHFTGRRMAEQCLTVYQQVLER